MTVITFGAVPGGKLSDDFSDATADGKGPNGCGTFILDSELAAGKKKIRMVTNPDYSPVYYNDPTNVRVHMQGNARVVGLLEPKGRSFARCFSIKWDSGTPLPLYAGDEIHGDKAAILGQGPAPSNLCWSSPPNWVWIIRGGGNPNVKGSYTEKRWTIDPIQTGIWLHCFLECGFSPDASKGYVHAWATPHLQQMRETIALTKCATAFPDPIKHYPIISCYYPRSVKGWHDLEWTAGGYSADPVELRAFQADQIGYDPWGPVAPPTPKLRKKAESASTITLEWDPIANVYGYRFFAGGVPVSTAFDPTRHDVTFSKGAAEYAVLPLEAGELLTYKP